MTQPDFSLEARDSRLASWGAAPPSADRLATRIAGGFERASGQKLPRDSRRRDGRRPEVPQSRMEGSLVESLSRIAPVHTDDGARRGVSLGKSYPDLLAARGERLERCFDVVVRPRSEDEVDRAMTLLAQHDVAVVPVGGGSSVVGGIEPLAARDDQPVAALDLTELDAVLEVDEVSRVARIQAGASGPSLERQLASLGLTLGHVPQSFHLSTLGGWIATRSAGQQSLAFGKIERMTAGVRVTTPTGVLNVDHLPAHGAGPGTMDMVLGSEGTLGVITEATMRVVPRPQVVRFSTYLATDFETAVEAARLLVQRGLRPAMVRVSDPQETAFSIGSSLPRLLRSAPAAKLVRASRYAGASMVMVVTPGNRAEAIATEVLVDRHMRSRGLRSVGPMPARHWYHARFVQPFVRDQLIDRGLLVDTLETAAPWRAIEALRTDVREALESELGREAPCIVGCHLSHLYTDGASAYFTFVARPRPGDELERWRAAKRAAHAAISRHRGAASHQHGIGTMHADLYRATSSTVAIDAWRAARSSIDPQGLCNPGKAYDPPDIDVVPLNAVHPPRPRGEQSPKPT